MQQYSMTVSISLALAGPARTIVLKHLRPEVKHIEERYIPSVAVIALKLRCHASQS